ncbi:hypothetical protein [Levilactobacillus cerevisiae]|uniref:hypothetical protein n=1 Tax=Levilactobacillus cerevisiae TaxID=1704076 RepID=UPI001CDC132A|nr:hypothetical protein [Levilactobacillus cerevisiae]
MKLYLKGVMIATAIVGWGWHSSIVGEASNYSARRANSVRLVWRHSMGRHAYHTVKGARYSKHLGVKYSTNDDLPDVTWYTDAHEKLYNKAKRTSAIYYHVKSGDGQHGGWIWRGYLTAGQAAEVAGTTSQQSDNPKVVLFNAKSSAEYQHAIETQDYYALAKNVWALFPGTKLNLWLSQFTAYSGIIGSQNKHNFDGLKSEGVSSPGEIVSWDLGNRWKELQDSKSRSMSERIKWLTEKLNQSGLSKVKREQFKDWYIGLNFVDDENDGSNINYNSLVDSDEHPFHYEIILAPPTSFQTLHKE